MKKIYLIVAVLFTLLSVVFAVLPLDTIAFLPIGLGVVFSLIALSKSEIGKTKMAKTLLFICGICSVVVLSKTIFIKDKIEQDTQFEQTKIETKKEAQKELEDLEGL